MSENEEFITIWSAPTVIKPTFRLYYDDKGNVICYTCEQLEGNFIEIDSQTFAEARPDVRVVNGKISTVASNLVISKLQPHDTEGVSKHTDDISVIVSNKVKTKKQKWKLVTKEYG